MAALDTQTKISADWLPLQPPTNLSKPSTEWWLSILRRALISRAMDDLEVSKEYRPNPDKPHERLRHGRTILRASARYPRPPDGGVREAALL